MIYKSYQEYRKAWFDAPNNLPEVPINVDLELSAICNLQCPFCFFSSDKYKKLKHKPFMDLELALSLIHECANMGVSALKFNWRGEPSLHPHFTKILKEAFKIGKFWELIVNTNGNCPDSSYRGFLSATKVIISIDSFIETTYQKMRKNGRLMNIYSLIEYLLGQNHMGIVLRRTITEDNKHEDFIKTAEKLYGYNVQVEEHYAFDRNKYSEKELKKSKKLKRIYCGYPNQRLVISTEGNVFPCCVDYNETMNLGIVDTFNTKLLNIWKCDKLNILRKVLNENELYPIHWHYIKENKYACENCTSWMAYNSKKRDKIIP